MPSNSSTAARKESLPTISLVTPSLNQAQFLEAALRSALNEGYAKLQYVVMDGGSTDGSCEILQKYAGRLHYWTSGVDRGNYDAINKGFLQTNGEIMGWLNADDLMVPWALDVVAEVFAAFPEVEWVTTRYPLRWDDRGRVISCRDAQGYSRRALLAGDTVPGKGMRGIWPIQQAATFWRRSLWERAGGLFDISFGAAADFELWLRFAKLADPVALGVPLGGIRKHDKRKEELKVDFYQEQAREAFEHNLCERSSSWHRWWRDLARRRGRGFWNGVSTTLGFFYPAWRVERTKDGRAWQKELVYL
jgi:glycosyltransferase involved in cell wall biosynthesis